MKKSRPTFFGNAASSGPPTTFICRPSSSTARSRDSSASSLPTSRRKSTISRLEDYAFKEYEQDYIDYIDHYFDIRLGVFMVDHGGTAHRIKSKVRKFFKKREDLEVFMDLVYEDQVEITVLTGLEGQQRIVERNIRDFDCHGVKIQSALIPQLGDLLTMK